ncbi:MAG: hypothetical protein V1647_04640 [Pseudomonadota bacterium]
MRFFYSIKVKTNNLLLLVPLSLLLVPASIVAQQSSNSPAFFKKEIPLVTGTTTTYKPKRVLGSKQGYGIMEMENNCTIAKNNLYLKITPAPNTTRDLLSKENPRQLSDPADFLYVRFEKCKYRITDYLYEVTDCKPIPGFIGNADNTYWNFKDVFSSIKTRIKIDDALCYVRDAAAITAVCMMGGWVFADTYTSAVAAGQGTIAATAAGTGFRIQLVEMLGATAAGTSYDTIDKHVTNKDGKKSVQMEAISCITADQQLSRKDALSILLNPTFTSGLWPICIDSGKIMRLDDFMGTVEDELIAAIDKGNLRKQVWGTDSNGKSVLLRIGEAPVSDKTSVPLDLKLKQEPAKSSTTYVAPVVVPLDVKQRQDKLPAPAPQ